MNTHQNLIRRSYLLVTGLIAATILAGLPFAPSSRPVAAPLPAQLSDQQFWKLSGDSSEPDGTFRSDNLLSNESFFQWVIPDLMRTTKPGRVYMGVGPEQNFTYIAATRPRMAFIIDIRRGNLDLLLMYKALFELSQDRAEFVSRLFSKKRPEGLTTQSTAREIFTAFVSAETSDELYKENLKAIENHLTEKHGFPLSADDVAGIEYVYSAFHRYGPAINYSSTSGGFGGFGRATYANLMTENDGKGQNRSYLANEDSYAYLKDLESKNLIVPVVGDFAGPKAIRAIGKYLKDMDATVSAFYLSNVEQFLRQDGIWNKFCGSSATLPLDDTSTFIRSVRGGSYGPGPGLSSELGNMLKDLKECASNEK